MKLKLAKTQTTEVLYYLLKRDSITFSQIHFDTGIINLSARLSDLKHHHDLPIEIKYIERKNKFGRAIRFGSWILTDKQKGLITYNELNK